MANIAALLSSMDEDNDEARVRAIFGEKAEDALADFRTVAEAKVNGKKIPSIRKLVDYFETTYGVESAGRDFTTSRLKGFIKQAEAAKAAAEKAAEKGAANGGSK